MRMTHRQAPSLSRLREVALFRGCSDRQLERVDRLVCVQDVREGEILCRQGAYGRQTFVIASGQAEVTIDGASVATLGPGSFFGELSVLDGDRRVATVTSLTPMTLLVLSGAELETLLADVPRVTRRMLATMGGRLRLADRALGATGSEAMNSGACLSQSVAAWVSRTE